MKAVILILTDARGIYIPRDFLTDNLNEISKEHCEHWGLNESNKEHWVDAVNPDSEWYWDAWDWILSNAKFKAENGDVYRLHQDGDLWGICFEKMTDDEKQNFGFESEN